MQEASDIYAELSRAEETEEDMSDYVINYLATLATQDKVEDELISDLEGQLPGAAPYEVCFNQSLYFSNRDGQEMVAIEKLQESYDVVQKEEEEKEPVDSKFHILGYHIAASILSQNKISGTPDVPSLETKVEAGSYEDLIVTNNEIALRAQFTNVDGDLKKLSGLIEAGLKSFSLTHEQTVSLYHNVIEINMRRQRTEAVHTLLKTAAKDGVEKELIRKYKLRLLLSEKKFEEIEKMVGEPKNLFEALVLAQAKVVGETPKAALSSLITYFKNSSDSNVRVQSLVLKSAVDSNMTDLKQDIIDLAMTSDLSPDLLVFIGDILTAEGKFEEGNKVYARVKSGKTDANSSRKAQASVLSSLAETDINDAYTQIEGVKFDKPAFENELEMQEIIEHALPEAKEKKKREAKDKVEELKSGGRVFIPKKKKRKIIYPKNFDPENPGALPHPERWLPKWQRRKKGRRFRATGPQGDAANAGRQISNKVSTATKDATQSKKKR